jgi:hypothetical protein
MFFKFMALCFAALMGYFMAELPYDQFSAAIWLPAAAVVALVALAASD